MPTYIALCKVTEQGIKDIKNGPKRAEAAKKTIEKMGGKMTAFYLTMGEYDYVAIADAPSDEVAFTFLLGLGTAGNVKTVTMKAFTLEEFAKMAKNLP